MTAQQDFTLEGYGQLLEAALGAGYRFVRYQDIGKEESRLSCVLRHDVDAEIFACEAMLRVEAEHGVKATYFVMTRSTAYNLFCLEGRRVVERMLADGHELGLHYMGELHAAQPAEELVTHVLREVAWLEAEFGTQIRAVSFHQPSKAVLDADLYVGSLINTYNRKQMDGYFYVSDTNMQWRQEHPRDIFARQLHPRLQLLIHPIWWTREARSIEEKWALALRSNAETVVAHWQQRERTLQGVPLAERLLGGGRVDSRR